MAPDWLTTARSPSGGSLLIAGKRPGRSGSRRISRHINRMHYSMIVHIIIFALDDCRCAIDWIFLGLEEHRAALLIDRLPGVVEIHHHERAITAQRSELPISGELKFRASGYRNFADNFRRCEIDHSHRSSRRHIRDQQQMTVGGRAELQVVRRRKLTLRGNHDFAHRLEVLGVVKSYDSGAAATRAAREKSVAG